MSYRSIYRAWKFGPRGQRLLDAISVVNEFALSMLLAMLLWFEVVLRDGAINRSDLPGIIGIIVLIVFGAFCSFVHYKEWKANAAKRRVEIVSGS